MTASDALDTFDRFALSLPALPGASPPQVDNPDGITESIPDAVEAVDSLAQTDEGATAPVPALGAQQIVLLDPCLIRPGSIPNRDKAAFDQVEFRHLQASITLAGVNVQPILVRRARLDDAGTVYEIIYGERRHQACLLAGLPVRALVLEDIDESAQADVNAPVDATADFLATFRENQGRADLAPWELGRQIAFALARGYFSSQRKAAQEIGRDVGDVSRALQLAALAPEVVSAFATPLDLQFRHAKPLSDALKKAPEAVLAEALRLQAEGKALAPGQVLARLVAAADEVKAKAQTEVEAESNASVGPSNTAPLDVAIEVEGQAIARLVTGRDGLVQVRMAQALNDKQRTQLAEQLRAFYKRCVAKAPPRPPPQAGSR